MTKTNLPPHAPLVLIILDGWGHRSEYQHNAISAARTLIWDQLWRNYPHTLLVGSGLAVGLPKGQMGNSEVGHLHMGAGRQLLQDLTRIDLAIESGEFLQNPILMNATDKAAQTNKALHVLGLLSPGGVHSHEKHIYELIRMAAQRGVKQLYVHAFLDGRDTPPQSAKKSIIALEHQLSVNGGKIASIMGRYYAMDRDKRWERTQRAYDLLTLGEAKFTAISGLEALQIAYDRNETDEFVQPTIIHAASAEPHVINDGDVVVFMNFRADRARQLSRALTQPDFTYFNRKRWPQLGMFASLTEYATDIPGQIAFPLLQLNNIFGECIANMGYKQLRLAETEKYAHVTFFFNGGVEKPYEGEERLLVPSPKVATYDLQPEMSAYELTQELVKAIKSKQYATIICNFANPDMVGHTGDFAATVKAIETIDNCLGIITEALHSAGGEGLITSDHGNAELMFDPITGQPHTAHTTSLVPVIYIGRDAKPTTEEGVLYDIAPTMLHLLGIAPQEMTGKPLFELI